ncbi:MAG: alpha/beta hydrolase [Candidatus Hydrogenedentes bacterium]|jgi:predicted esterase|nr:alpha/beta hydrolase [Candidatus Hydrogenedentota bacterium]
MNPTPPQPVEILYRPAASLRLRPKTKKNYTQQCNVVYAEAHGIGLVMDIFIPKHKTTNFAVLDVISSGWRSDRVILNEHVGLGAIDALCELGITVFAVLPGSASLFTASEMVGHVQAAIRHIKNNGKVYEIQPERLAILGVSAGGHLGALTALNVQRGRTVAYDPLRRWSTDVAAIALFFPPTDLVDYGGRSFDPRTLDSMNIKSLFFHCSTEKVEKDTLIEMLTRLSPARVTAHNPPPFLIVQGKEDPIVPWKQAEKLAASLRTAGGEVDLVYKEKGGHPWPDIDIEIEKAAQWLYTKLQGVVN